VSTICSAIEAQGAAVGQRRSDPGLLQRRRRFLVVLDVPVAERLAHRLAAEVGAVQAGADGVVLVRGNGHRGEHADDGDDDDHAAEAAARPPGVGHEQGEQPGDRVAPRHRRGRVEDAAVRLVSHG
jgi:hypothetical protein